MTRSQTDKQRAHMYFKQHKIGMSLTNEEIQLVKRFYPFMRNEAIK